METKEIAKALVKAQSEMSNPIKEAENPFFKKKYADLNAVREAVMPPLNKYGIVVLQPMVTIDGKNYIKTVLLHESGESLESHTEILNIRPNDPQGQGSGISYARRYALQSFVCVGADDDDGNAATGKTEQQQPAPPSQKPVLEKMKGKDMTNTWQQLVKRITAKEITSLDKVKEHYTLAPELETELSTLIHKVNGTN